MYAHSLHRLDHRPAEAPAATQAIATRSPPRHDLYGDIHKALRAFLSSTLTRVGRIDVHDPVDSDEALDQLTAALDFLTAHLRHEDEFVHPAIESRHPYGTARASLEHATHASAIARLHDGAAALRSAGRDDSDGLAQKLYLDLGLLVAETLEHLHHEETTLSPLLWQLFDDEELAEIHGRLRASISPTDMLSTLRWALPACTPSARAALVSELRAVMPPAALASVLVGVREYLDPAGWIKLARVAGIDAESDAIRAESTAH